MVITFWVSLTIEIHYVRTTDHSTFLRFIRDYAYLSVCLYVCSSLPRRSFTSLVALCRAWGWNCRPCSRLSSHRSARRCSEASCWTLLTCWLQPMASSRCSMKRPPSECPAATDYFAWAVEQKKVPKNLWNVIQKQECWVCPEISTEKIY